MSGLPEERLETRLPDAKPLYTPDQAKAEADRCLYCYDAPCIKACPTSIDIPTFIKKIANGNIQGAASTILESNILGYSCARVCPVEVLCVGDCVYNEWDREPIHIGKLQRFATETAVAQGKTLITPKPRGAHSKRVACVGAGPASLACAAELAIAGHHAVLFEKRALPGGLNTTGVAPYKMHAHDAIREVEFVRNLGVEIRQGEEIDQAAAQKLLSDYDAVFLGLGLGDDTRLGVPGEDGPGVEGATAFIERLKTAPGFALAGVTHAIVVGGGNTAIDVARELAQLGIPDVAMVYRRSAQAMTGYVHELEHARLERVRFVENAQPVAVLRDGERVTALRVADTEYGKPIAGTEHDLPAQLVVLAIGQSKLRTLAQAFGGVALDDKGRVVVEAETKRTGNAKVYAGGDCINGGKEVVNAVADGRDAARAMLKTFSLSGKTSWPTFRSTCAVSRARTPSGSPRRPPRTAASRSCAPSTPAGAAPSGRRWATRS